MKLYTDDIKQAVEILRDGGVVVFATETAYGLAADARNAHAVARLMAIKGREGWKTPPLVAADQAMVERFCLLSTRMKQLTQVHLPGPLTIVVPVRFVPTPGVGTKPVPTPGVGTECLALDVIREGTVAIRVSSHETASLLSELLGAPIVSTSANLTGGETCYDTACVHAQFDTRLLQPDFYLNEGLLPFQMPSTIVTEQNGSIVILRQGEIIL